MRARSLFVCLLGTLVVMSSLATAEAFSQPRHGGPPPGGPPHGGGGHGAVYVGVGGYWGWGGPFYSPYYWPWWGYPYFGWGPSWYYGATYDPTSGVRLQVTPKQAEVFVDGYLAGTVDDFDGTFQRLRLVPGEHELVIYLDGYRTVRQKLLLTAGADFKVRHTMEPLAPGEAPEPRPQPAAPPPPAQTMQGGQPQQWPEFPPAQPDPRRAPMPPQPSSPPQPPSPQAPPPPLAQGFGTLSIRVQPGGADVMVDGERWVGPEATERLDLQLGEGVHRVEVQKEGFKPYSADVQVRRGERTTLNVSLPVR